MGGTGSGRYSRHSTKPTEEHFHLLRIARMRKLGALKRDGYSSGLWQWTMNDEVCSSISYETDTRSTPAFMRVHYRNTHTDTRYDYRIALTSTTPHYGGKRWWFICPNAGCGKRVGVLCLAEHLACRHCYNMAYSSQNEAPAYRLLYKAQALHRALGGNGMTDMPVNKPKHMHWKTYHRKLAEMHHASELSDKAAFAAFGFNPNEW